ncbi:alpha/beta hydrolase [Nocardiopsis synnemataformans]|uniref:alpha/beta hydrolase n=1 Tax=Nocardiopsis synnemataformans TaxID=61305 RepID=UPI003EB7B9AB
MRASAVDVLTRGLDIRDEAVPGEHGPVPVRRYDRADGPTVAALVWVHGGAFSHGGLDQLESHAVAAALAQRGVGVVAVDYRRVPAWNWFRDAPPGPLPGVRYPLPLDDVASVYETVRRARPDAWLGGASAGACLSAAAALRLAARDATVPAGLVLAYGTFHAALPPIPEHVRARVRGRHGLAQIRAATVRRMNHNYAGSAEAMGEPFAFPGGHDLRGLPDTLVVDADRDTLRASGEAFARELAAAGVPVDHHVVAESRHGFLDRPEAPYFTEGIALIADRLTAPRKDDSP